VLSAPHASQDIARVLAPTGVLRAAINAANAVLARRMPTGQLDGAALRIAAEVAAALDVGLEPVVYASAGKVTQAVAADEWDLGFLAIDPARVGAICFTQPYLYIDSTYLVRPNGPACAAEVDVPGMRIAVAKGAAYELYLSRELRHAQLVHATTPDEAFAQFASGAVDAMAGVRQALRGYARQHPGTVLDGHFQQVSHALALPARAVAALSWIDAMLDRLKRTGFLRAAMHATGQGDATLAP
jgi:polar amino acid transport system substrate-binding protein